MITVWQCLLASLKGFKMASTRSLQRYLLPLLMSSTCMHLQLRTAPKVPACHRGIKPFAAVLQFSTNLFFIFPQNSKKSDLIHSALSCVGALHLPYFTTCVQQTLTFTASFLSRYKLGFLSGHSHLPTFMHTCISLKSLNSC